MIRIPGGRVRTGSDSHYPEERPARIREIHPFLLDSTQTTNRAFAGFVAATGWRTQAERNEPAGSMVFTMSEHPVDLHNPALWWRFVPGAAMAQPGRARNLLPGQGRSPGGAYRPGRCRRVRGLARRAAADRMGVGGSFARRPRRCHYCWGNEFSPDGALMANIWTGAFRGISPAERPARRRSAVFRRTGSACTTWPEMSGSGQPANSTARAAARRHPPARTGQ